VQLLPEVWSNQLPPEDRGRFERELTRIGALTYSELSRLPDYSELARDTGKSKSTLRLHREALPDGPFRIVLQNYRHRFLIFGFMMARGYLVKSDGSISELPEKDLWDYM
jgi:hypothetical protein